LVFLKKIITSLWKGARDHKDYINTSTEHRKFIDKTHVIDPKIIPIFNEMEPYERDVKLQSAGLQKKMEDFLKINKREIIGKYSASTSRELRYLMKKSNFGTVIPFSHEKYIRLLRDSKNVPVTLSNAIKLHYDSYYYLLGMIGNSCWIYPVIKEVDLDFKGKKHNGIYLILSSAESIIHFFNIVGVSEEYAERIGLLTASEIAKIKSAPDYPNLQTLFWDTIRKASVSIDERIKQGSMNNGSSFDESIRSEILLGRTEIADSILLGVLNLIGLPDIPIFEKPKRKLTAFFVRDHIGKRAKCNDSLKLIYYLLKNAL